MASEDVDSDNETIDEDSTYFDAILDYETKLDRQEQVDPEEIIAQYPAAESRLREYFQRRQNAAQLLGSTTGRRAPDFIDIQNFGFYSVMELMDWGGNASIHRVTDVRFGRTAALKIPLKKWASDPHALRRLEREAQLSGRLQHPNIVPIYDVGTTTTSSGELPYFTMRLVKGRQFSDLLQERQSPAQDQFRFIFLFRQICQAVAYAHDQGILHRDLKPNNVMVGDFDDAYVMDWGYAKDLLQARVRPAAVETRPLAQFLDDIRGHTDDLAQTIVLAAASESVIADDEMVLGTPAYLPPEIAQRSAKAADRRSDVFCLGGILCAILTGEATYRGVDVLDVSRQAYAGDVSDALKRIAESGAAPELIDLASACLAPKPEDRPADAKAVADRVTQFIHRQEEAKLEAERQTAREAQAKFVAERHSRRLTVGLAATLLAFVCSGAGVVLYSVETARLARRAETVREIEHRLELADSIRQQAEERELNSLSDADYVLGQWGRYLAAVDQAGSVGIGSESLPEQKQEIELARARGEERITEIQRWRQLVADLESAADLTTLAIDEYAPSQEIASQEFQNAFQRFGVTYESDHHEKIVAALAPLPGGLRERIVAALDRWALLGNSFAIDKFDLGTEILKSAPAWRDAIRTIHAARDAAALRQLITDSEKDPTSLSPSFYLIATGGLLQWGTAAEAIELNQNARDRFRNEYSLHLQAGSLHATLPVPQLDRAEDAFRAALAVSPQSPTGLAALGYVLRQKGLFPQAKSLLQLSLEREPSFPWALTNLGIITLTVEGDAKLAESYLQRALTAFPKYPLAADTLSLVYSMTGRWDKALGIHASLGLNPQASSLRSVGLTIRHFMRGYFIRAATEWEKLVRHPLFQSRRKMMVSYLHLLRGDLDLAEKVATSLRADGQYRFDRVMGAAILGMIYLFEGRNAEADGIFLELSREVPEFHLGTVGLAMTSLVQGRITETREKIAELQHLDVVKMSAMNGLVTISINAYLSILNVFLGPADELLKAPTKEGVRLRVLNTQDGYFIYAAAELAVMRQRAYLAYCIYEEILAELPGSALAGINGLVNFWQHPTHRMNALRSIGLLFSGRAADQVEFVDPDYPRMHALGQRWLRSELKGWSRMAGTPNGRVRVKIWVYYCKRCPDLAGIRDPEFLEKMDVENREKWQQLWTEIDALLVRLNTDSAPFEDSDAQEFESDSTPRVNPAQ
jgi:serine/threonine protein kinase/Flp pilus assembly protein TadD